MNAETVAHAALGALGAVDATSVGIGANGRADRLPESTSARSATPPRRLPVLSAIRMTDKLLDEAARWTIGNHVRDQRG
jgi:hypothetical protein